MEALEIEPALMALMDSHLLPLEVISDCMRKMMDVGNQSVDQALIIQDRAVQYHQSTVLSVSVACLYSSRMPLAALNPQAPVDTS